MSESNLFYPKKKNISAARKALEEKRNMPKECPICEGQGMLPDAKTRKIRDCVVCRGEGKLKIRNKIV